MGTTCCQGRIKSTPASSLLSSKSFKRKRRSEYQRRSTKSRDDAKRKTQDLVLTSFSNLFQRLSKTPEALEEHTQGEANGERYLRSESVHLDLHTTQVSALATPLQVTIKELMLDMTELPISIFSGSFTRSDVSNCKCQIVMSTQRLYFINEDTREDVIDLLDIAAFCIYLKGTTCLLHLCMPEPDQVTIVSEELREILKALQFLSYQTHRCFIPVVTFNDEQEMKLFAEELTLSDINAMHSMENLKAQEVIFTSGGEVDEAVVLFQPCTYLCEARFFLLSNRHFYILTKDYSLVLKRPLSEIWNVKKDSDCTVISSREWRVELGMADCSAALNEARSCL